ncbi:hypothetical protein CEXT_419051 [Caerostris extrusa]|uniref:Uncharacterized protein n=1 Tax=Caerostris extrusa TaxID=172846 RepID=A0AAV4S031_CAEEX|nr:hypothetical protein CEXT_419051 [Caerostris extrusa]
MPIISKRRKLIYSRAFNFGEPNISFTRLLSFLSDKFKFLLRTHNRISPRTVNFRKKQASNKKKCITPGANTLCHKRETRRICNSDLQNNFQGCQEWLEICINLHTFELETLFPFLEVVQWKEFFNQSGKQMGIVLCVEKARL